MLRLRGVLVLSLHQHELTNQYQPMNQAIKNSILPLVKAEFADDYPTRTELRLSATNWGLWLGLTEEETEDLIAFLESEIVTVIKAIPTS